MNKDSAPGHIDLSIIVPVYNDSENILPFYERTLGVLDKTGLTFEFIYINDGSKDDSLEVMTALHNKDARVKVVGLSRNYGKEIAMTAGIDYSRGDGVIPMDVDLQDPPELIPELITKWREGFDVVYATRVARHGEGPFKKFTAWAFYKLINKLSRTAIPQNTGDFRLLDRKVVRALGKLREQHRFMKGLFSWVGFRQTGIPYQRERRFAGRTKWNYWKLFDFAIEGITSFSYVPLKMASFMGMLVALISFIYGTFLVIRTLTQGSDVPGYASTMVVILFLGGVQLIAIGVNGEYLGRIYDESKNRSLYFVRDLAGLEDKDEGERNE